MTQQFPRLYSEFGIVAVLEVDQQTTYRFRGKTLVAAKVGGLTDAIEQFARASFPPTYDDGTPMRGYHDVIFEATGLRNRKDLDDVEESMRQDIFHSTLDWQTAAQLREAAREAWEIVQALRDPALMARLEAQFAREFTPTTDPQNYVEEAR